MKRLWLLPVAALAVTACQSADTLDTPPVSTTAPVTTPVTTTPVTQAPKVDIGEPAVDDMAVFRTAMELALYQDYDGYCDAFWNLSDDAVIVAIADGFGRNFTAREEAIVLDVFYSEC
jgi:hypothetical protein